MITIKQLQLINYQITNAHKLMQLLDLAPRSTDSDILKLRVLTDAVHLQERAYRNINNTLHSTSVDMPNIQNLGCITPESWDIDNMQN